jgi:hypothetical protein
VTERTYEYHALLLDGEGERVLVVRWEEQAPRHWHVISHVNEAVRELAGIEATTLRCLANERVDESRVVRVYELEAHEPMDGVDPGAVDDLPAEALARWRAEPDPELGVEWALPGWYDRAVAWIGGQVDVAGPIEQLRTWSISMVLRVPTPNGDVYFKAVPPLFAAEPALTRELGRRQPGRAPTVLAADLDRRWMLMEDFDGDDLSADTWEDALQTYARLQLDWIERTDRLRDLGCPDRGLAALVAEIDPVLGDRGAMLGFSDEELAQLPTAAERVRESCARLAEHELPETLEHGDLHAGNIRARIDGFLFYDWSDGCVSVPFFGLVPFFLDVRDGRERLRDAYLEPWGAHLSEAFELAQLPGLFHHAVSYHRIVTATEPRARWEWEQAFPYFVRQLLV